MGALKIGAIVGAVVGIVLVLLASILGWAVLPKVIDNKIKEEVRLIEGSETWDKWSDIELPIEFKFYIFHVLNADDVENNGAEPILEERGPYIYNEKRKKYNLEVDGDIISYTQPIEYFYDEAKSGRKDNETADIINVPYLSVIHKVKNIPIAGPIVNRILYDKGERVIRRGVMVKDLTFDGMDVSRYAFLGPLLPAEFDGLRFGLYKGNNGSDDGVYRIHSGVATHTNFGEIETWNKQTLGYWNGTNFDGSGTISPLCDMINGTDGSIFPPFVDEDRILRVFVVDLCRSLYLTYKERSEVFGIKAYRFSVPAEALDDPRENIYNQCFCLDKEESKNDCPGGGALDVEVCRGAPIVMSAPYFLDGDGAYRANVSMNVANSPMMPNRDLHETTMDLEPHSGVLLSAKKRLQVNMKLEKSDLIGFRNVRDFTIFPLVWVEESAGVDEANAEDLKDKLLKPMKIIDVAKWTILGVGIVLTILGAIVAWKA